MQWTEMQHAEMARRFESGGTQAVADYAVELAAARGGLTLEQIQSLSRQELVDRVIGQVATLQAKVAELERRLAMMTDLRDSYRKGGTMEHVRANQAETEVERLKAEKVGWATELEQRALAAESRLAAVRMCLLEHDTEEGPDFVETVNGVRHALEGDAPNPSMPSNGSGEAQIQPVDDMDLLCTACEQCTVHSWNGASWWCHECSGISKAGRYPCSATCTHDDAATAGHHERIAARSKALATEDDGGVLASDEPYPERMKDRSEAFIETAERAGFDEGMSKGWDDGADAMRAVIQSEVREWLYKNGYDPTRDTGLDLMKTIEGATP